MMPIGFSSLPGHYQLRTRLGEGGFGEVFEAWDGKLCRSVAIKCIKAGIGSVSGATLLHEARLAASLRHAAFVKVHAIEDDTTTQYIVMEMVPGQTLKEVLASSMVDVSTALGWIIQIAEAMRDAHASKLVHGDLKPSNLMLEPDGRIRILDFGLALREDPLRTTSLDQVQPYGTIAYMAPERLLGGRPSAQADIYALGVLFYEMVFGARPFASLQGLPLAVALMQTSSDAWTYPSDLTESTASLIRAMTARTSALRLASMDLVLQRARALSGPHVPPPASLLSWQRWRQQRGGRRTLAAIAGVGVLTLFAVLTWQVVPQFHTAPRVAPPLSQTLELNSGLAALARFDPPRSIDEARAHFQRVLARYPDNAAAVAGMSLAYSLRYLSDLQDEVWLQKADASAQQALQLDAQLALSQAARGWVLANQGRHGEALAAHARALGLDPANVFAWYGQVQTLRRARRYPEALQRVHEAIERFPKERLFTDELGSMHYELEDYRAAERAFRHSIALQPDAVSAYASLNAVLQRQNRPDEALQVLQQGLQVRPSAMLYGNLGNALFLRGDYVGAAEAFGNAVSPVRGAPGDYLNWANLADTLLWIPGRELQARQAYDKARQLLAPRLARTPNDVMLISRMGLYSARAGDTARAMLLLRRALELAPANADVQFRAGLAYELLGQRDKALQAIVAARRLNYPNKFIEAEPDLVNLRRDAAYPAD